MSYGKPKPSPRDRIMREIRRFWREYNYPPTMLEIANALGYSSKEGVRPHLRYLRERGVVSWQEGAGRTIRIVEAA